MMDETKQRTPETEAETVMILAYDCFSDICITKPEFFKAFERSEFPFVVVAPAKLPPDTDAHESAYYGVFWGLFWLIWNEPNENVHESASNIALNIKTVGVPLLEMIVLVLDYVAQAMRAERDGTRTEKSRPYH
jgi:hypothetical protein